MKFQELKSKVYELAEVSTTQQIKVKYIELKTLDMRRKASWEKALTIIQKHQIEFETWRENPPEEYKNIFLEITEISQDYDQTSTDTKHLIGDLLSIADGFTELSEEYQEEANQLRKSIKKTRQISDKSKLN